MCNFHHFLFDSDIDWMAIDNSMMKIKKSVRRLYWMKNYVVCHQMTFVIRHFMLAIMYVHTRTCSELTMRRTIKCFVTLCYGHAYISTCTCRLSYDPPLVDVSL